MGIFSGFGGLRLDPEAVESMVRRALVFPVGMAQLAGMLPNWFDVAVPRSATNRIGLRTVAELFESTLAALAVEGRVARRFILVAQTTTAGSPVAFTPSIATPDALDDRLREEWSRADNGLCIVIAHPKTLISVKRRGMHAVEFDRSFRFGRASDNDFVVDNECVSNYHGQVVYIGDHWEVEDLSSMNGTVLNGRSVRRHRISAGDVIHTQGSPLFEVEGEREWALPARPLAALRAADAQVDCSRAPHLERDGAIAQGVAVMHEPQRASESDASLGDATDVDAAVAEAETLVRARTPQDNPSMPR